MAAIMLRGRSRSPGFTLIELMLVLVLIALLAGIATPVIFNSISNARESTLKENLMVMRKAIDGYYADNKKYPESLQVLVDKRYIRSIPVDPVTENSDTWVFNNQDEGIIDVHSGSTENSNDGTPYRDW